MSTAVNVLWIGFDQGFALLVARTVRKRDTVRFVSSENVEASRRFWELFNDRDWDAWWGLLDEDVEWHARADEPDAGVHHGHEGVRQLRDMWVEMFPDLRLELAGESIDLDEQVITPTHLVGKGRTSGLDVREPYSWLFRMREGKIVVVREFHNNAEALEAVGE